MLRFQSRPFCVPFEIIDTLVKEYCTNCPICKGICIHKSDHDKWTKCECLEKYGAAYALYAAKIPKEYHVLTIDDFDPEWQRENAHSFNRAMSYSRQLQKALDTRFGLYLWGDSGGGKTLIAVLLLKRAIREGFTTYFILLRDLIKIALDGLHNSSIQEDVEKLMLETDFLVIDDVDKVTAAREQDLVNTVVLALLKKRTQSGKPLIVTANCPNTKLGRAIGSPLAAAITERSTSLFYKGGFGEKKIRDLEEKFFK